MNLEDVKNLRWIKVSDWDGLTETHFNKDGDSFVSDNDMENFINNLFKEISRKLDIPYNDLIPILKSENVSFYEAKERLFKKYAFGSTNRALNSLKMLLRIPDVESIPMVPKIDSQINSKTVLDSFYALSEIEKLEVLKELKLLSIKIEFLK